MNTHIMTLAKEAGFIFWGDEDWGPGPGNIDWSCDYSAEFERFGELILQTYSIPKSDIYDMVSTAEKNPDWAGIALTLQTPAFTLSRAEVFSLQEIANNNPEIDQLTLSFDTSSGIGTGVKVLFGQAIEDITDVSNW